MEFLSAAKGLGKPDFAGKRVAVIGGVIRRWMRQLRPASLAPRMSIWFTGGRSRRCPPGRRARQGDDGGRAFSNIDAADQVQ